MVIGGLGKGERDNVGRTDGNPDGEFEVGRDALRRFLQQKYIS